MITYYIIGEFKYYGPAPYNMKIVFIEWISFLLLFLDSRSFCLAACQVLNTKNYYTFAENFFSCLSSTNQNE